MFSTQPMPLREQLVQNGNWLFRWRSYLPLLVLVLLIPAFRHFAFPFGSHRLDEIWGMCCFMVSLFGLGIRIYTIGHVPEGTSGRNTREQVAETLNTTGIYSALRHPLYFGNFWMWIGVSLYVRQWWLVLLVATIFALYHERICIAEEGFLQKKFGNAFDEWTTRTPAFIPRFDKWVPPHMPFCWRTALRREYHGLFALIAIFALMEVAGHYLVENRLTLNTQWTWMFGVALVLYFVLRFIRKNTRLFHVGGR